MLYVCFILFFKGRNEKFDTKNKRKKKNNIRVTPETFLLFGPKIWGYEDDDTVIVMWNSY